MAAAISSTTQNQECFQCRKSFNKVYECAKCSIAKFCGKECQAVALKNGHKVECEKWSAEIVKANAEVDAMIESHKILSPDYAQRVSEKKLFYRKILFTINMCNNNNK